MILSPFFGHSSLVLSSSDPALKEYLSWLDKQPNSTHFIIAELDATHLFIVNSPEIETYLQLKVDEFHDSTSFVDVLAQDSETSSKFMPPSEETTKGSRKRTKKAKTSKAVRNNG